MNEITNLDCCICLESETSGSAVIEIPCCKSKIHKTCLITWLIYKMNITCPVCQTVHDNIHVFGITIDELFKIINEVIDLNKIHKHHYVYRLNILIQNYWNFYNFNVYIYEESSQTPTTQNLSRRRHRTPVIEFYHPNYIFCYLFSIIISITIILLLIYGNN